MRGLRGSEYNTRSAYMMNYLAETLNIQMQSFGEFILSERVLSIGLNPAHEKYREKHRGEIHDLLRHSYSKLGGYSGHAPGSKEESDEIHKDISNSAMKAVRRNGKISSVHLYKLKHGRKAIGLGTNGTDQGKTDAKKTFQDDHKQKRAWGEYSGAPEHIQRKMGVPVVHNKHAKNLTGKDVELDPNGEHYKRKIGQGVHTKVVMGHPKFDQD